MSASRLRLRPIAIADVDAIVGRYLAEGSTALALRFADTLDHALRQIALDPGDRLAPLRQRTAPRQLRVWPLRRFPHLVFYVEEPGQIDVWRILHGSRDIPATLR